MFWACRANPIYKWTGDNAAEIHIALNESGYTRSVGTGGELILTPTDPVYDPGYTIPAGWYVDASAGMSYSPEQFAERFIPVSN